MREKSFVSYRENKDGQNYEKKEFCELHRE